MLYLVLCSFSTLVGKYFPKLNQCHTSRRWYGQWFTLILEDLTEIQVVGEVLS